MRSIKHFTNFRATTFVRVFLGMILISMVLIATDHPAHAITNPNCLASKAHLIGLSVEICTTSVTSIEGYLQYDPANVNDFTDITIISPEMLQVRVYVLQDNIMPAEFSTGVSISVSSPGSILSEIERQYNLIGVNRIADSTQIAVNGNMIYGLSFDTSPQGPDIAAQSSYWSIEQNSQLLIIEIKVPMTDIGLSDSTLGSYHDIRLNIKPDTSVVMTPETDYTADRRGNYPIPSWWSGNCNVNNHPNSVVMGAFLGVYICSATGDDRTVYFFSGAHAELEWECVEFVMRYMYLAYGTKPYEGSGNDVYTNYSWTSGERLDKVKNGKIGKYPKRGDVMSFDWGTDGHTAVVKSSDVDSNGNGSYVTMNQNSDPYVVQTINVTNWNTGAIGWLHAPTFPVPTAVSASKDQIEKVVVTWDPVTGAIRYDVWRYRTNVPTVAERIASNVVSPYEDTTGTIGQSYNYWVTACNGDECSEFSTHAIGASIPQPPPTIRRVYLPVVTNNSSIEPPYMFSVLNTK